MSKILGEAPAPKHRANSNNFQNCGGRVQNCPGSPRDQGEPLSGQCLRPSQLKYFLLQKQMRTKKGHQSLKRGNVHVDFMAILIKRLDF